MVRRAVIVAASLLAAGTASAEPMNAEQARRFVVGKHFTYSCFDGTRGTGRINGDGSATGTVQVRGAGPVRYAVLPPGTLRVKGQSVCASLRGMPFEPCFNLDKTDAQSFRGSVWGFGFAYCDFTRRRIRPRAASTTWRSPASKSLSISARAAPATPAAE